MDCGMEGQAGQVSTAKCTPLTVWPGLAGALQHRCFSTNDPAASQPVCAGYFAQAGRLLGGSGSRAALESAGDVMLVQRVDERQVCL